MFSQPKPQWVWFVCTSMSTLQCLTNRKLGFGWHAYVKERSNNKSASNNKWADSKLGRSIQMWISTLICIKSVTDTRLNRRYFCNVSWIKLNWRLLQVYFNYFVSKWRIEFLLRLKGATFSLPLTNLLHWINRINYIHSFNQSYIVRFQCY